MKLSVLGTSGDHLGPSGTSGDHLGTIIRRSYRFLVIFHQNMSFSAKTALFKFRMSFFKKVRLKPHINQKSLKKVFQKWQFPRDFIEFVGKTTPDSEKKCCHGPN